MVKPEEIRDRQKLANLISQWNSEHYDLFELSPPNEVNMTNKLSVRALYLYPNIILMLFVVKFTANHLYR